MFICQSGCLSVDPPPPLGPQFSILILELNAWGDHVISNATQYYQAFKFPTDSFATSFSCTQNHWHLNVRPTSILIHDVSDLSPVKHTYIGPDNFRHLCWKMAALYRSSHVSSLPEWKSFFQWKTQVAFRFGLRGFSLPCFLTEQMQSQFGFKSRLAAARSRAHCDVVCLSVQLFVIWPPTPTLTFISEFARFIHHLTYTIGIIWLWGIH